jgi:SAM-dependent methyltransferase
MTPFRANTTIPLKCDLLRCAACGYIRNANPPAQNEIKGIEEANDAYDAWGLEQLAAYRPLATFIDGFYRGPRPGQLLEIGCAKGFLLADLRDQGWDVAGVELTEKTSGFARDTLRLPVICGPFEHTSFPTASFDLVVMCHVLEHVLEPSAVLRETHRILCRRGLVFAIVPDFGAYEAEGKVAEIVYPIHVSHFTSATMRILFRNAGFTVTFVDGFDRTVRMVGERAGPGWVPRIRTWLRRGRSVTPRGSALT